MTSAPASASSRPRSWASVQAGSPGREVLLPKTAIRGRVLVRRGSVEFARVVSEGADAPGALCHGTHHTGHHQSVYSALPRGPRRHWRSCLLEPEPFAPVRVIPEPHRVGEGSAVRFRVSLYGIERDAFVVRYRGRL